MNKIPKQMVTEITGHLSPEIVSFFERTKQLNKYGFQDLESFVAAILDEKVSDRTIDVKIVAAKETESRKKRRTDWISKTKKNYQTIDISDPASYFYRIANDFMYEPDKSLIKYGTQDVNAIIRDLFDKMEVWKENRDLLIRFPNFPYVGKQVNITNIFKSDLIYEIYQIILREYNGDVNYWSIKSPYGVESIFSAEKGYVPVEVQEDGSRKVSIYGEDLIIEKLTDTFTDDTLRVFDERDRLILSYLINNAHVDLKNPSPMQTVYTTTLAEITKFILGKDRSSSLQKQDTIKRLMRLTETVSSKSDDGHYKAIVVIGSLEIYPADENGRRVIEYTLGPLINNSIITNRIQSLPKSVYMSLSEDFSRTLYSRLQLERITMSLNGQTTKRYSFDYFKRILLIRSKSVSKLQRSIIKALDELLTHTDLIKEYKISGANIDITFHPIPKEELDEILKENDSPSLLEEHTFE